MPSTLDALDPEVTVRLIRLYGTSRGQACAAALHELLADYLRSAPSFDERESPWDERDVVLITYADQISGDDHPPLEWLRRFLAAHGLDELFSTVHLLPFYPYSSDDGFSVIDYLAVNPVVGTWHDVAKLRERFDLMFDLVLNHISQKSEWFQRYLQGESPYDRFFIEVDPTTDLSAVVRPRSLPLLTPVETSRGPRHVWTTFSDDQIDLNFAEPEVLLHMIAVLLDYVRRGARIVRLDAVAFLWKEPGTNCLHLPQTHEVVKLMRDVLSLVAPHVLLLTETNVPHAENVSYFGDGDEAHMVYQFSLPPLLLDAFVHGNATPITQWLAELEPPRPGTTYFNFTASHDGIGVRPLEGLVSPERFERVVAHVQSVGGYVSTRRQSDGTDTPYELNLTYLNALAPDNGPDTGDVELHVRRFLASQAVMLGLQGMPAVYFHSLVGTPNDHAGAMSSGQPRRINRRKFTLEELLNQLSLADTRAEAIFAGYRHLLEQRIAQPAFHPDASQQVVETHNSALLAFERTSIDARQKILVAVNFSNTMQTLVTPDGYSHDLIADCEVPSGKHSVAPGQAVWLTT